MFSALVDKWLLTALDFGISEFDFWNMTLAELNRALASKARVIEIEEQRRASFDYILSDIIGRSVARLYGSSNKMPTLSEAYPSLFDKGQEQEAIQQKKDELSAMRFKLFANSFNKRFEERGKENGNE